MAGDVAVPLGGVLGIEGNDGPSGRHGPEEARDQSRVQGRHQGHGSGAGVQGRDGLGRGPGFGSQAGIGQLALEVMDRDAGWETAGDLLEPIGNRPGPDLWPRGRWDSELC